MTVPMLTVTTNETEVAVDTLNDLGKGMLSGLGYGAIGLVLLAVGYKVIDALLPGDLGTQIYTERNANAALVVAAGLVALGAIVTTAIVTSDEEFGRGAANAAGYGLLGVVLLAVAFVVMDRLTPGKLGVICTSEERHPAVYVTMATLLTVGAIVSAAIS